jgi:ABC-type bacteriocin/lantibiotic exporter with double-glycine peptidase domain
MVLAYYGKHVSLSDVKKTVGVGSGRTTAHALINAARMYGLVGRGVKLEVEHISHLPTGAILFWNFRHFVVFERSLSDVIEIVDPTFGRCSISIRAFRLAFTGVALLFEPNDDSGVARLPLSVIGP